MPSMIPDSVRPFFDKPRFATLVMVEDGQPVMFRCAGVVLGATTLTVIVPPHVHEGRALMSSGRGAIVVSSLDYEAYQFKGEASVRPATPEECEAGHRQLSLIGAEVEAMMGIPRAMYEAIDTANAMAIVLTVDEAFAQSPRPGAGASLLGGAS
jgi:hypothetical protein